MQIGFPLPPHSRTKSITFLKCNLIRLKFSARFKHNKMPHAQNKQRFFFSNDDSISILTSFVFGPFRFLTMRYFKINHNFECLVVVVSSSFRGETWQKNSHFIKRIWVFARSRCSYSFHAWISIDEAINLLFFFRLGRFISSVCQKLKVECRETQTNERKKKPTTHNKWNKPEMAND